MESWMQSWRPRTNAFAIFPLHLSKVLRLPRISDAKSYKVLHLSHKITFANLKIWCSKMQHLSGNQRPDLLTSLMNMSLVLRLPQKMYLCRSSSNVTRLPSFLEMHETLTFCSLLKRCTLPCACHTKRRWSVQKWREHVVFCTFGLRKVVRATTACTFEHLNFQKRSGADVLCTFWLQNVLRATTACTFPHHNFRRALRSWRAVCILTWKCAFAQQRRRAIVHLSSGQLAPHPPV